MINNTSNYGNFYYCNEAGEMCCLTPDDFDNPFNKEIQQVYINLLLKPREWLNIPEINKMQRVMEPFLAQHLNKIQEVALERMETIHFSKKCNNRPPFLAHLSDLQNEYSLRVTKDGNVWILFSIENARNKLAYSPTCFSLGVKKTVKLNEVRSNLLAQSYASPLIARILDISKIWGKNYKNREPFLNTDKYSIITPKFDGSINNLIPQIMRQQRAPDSLLQVFNLQKLVLKSWINLVRETGIFHPDMHFGNVVYSYTDKNLLIKFIDFDELNKKFCLSKEILTNMDNFFITEDKHKYPICNIIRELIETLTENAKYLQIGNQDARVSAQVHLRYHVLCLIASLREKDLLTLDFESLNQRHGAEVTEILDVLKKKTPEGFYRIIEFIFEESLGEILKRMETFANLNFPKLR